jgi:mannosyltransferase OCH1-like enzyme
MNNVWNRTKTTITDVDSPTTLTTEIDRIIEQGIRTLHLHRARVSYEEEFARYEKRRKSNEWHEALLAFVRKD